MVGWPVLVVAWAVLIGGDGGLACVGCDCGLGDVDGGLGGAFLALPNEYVLASIPHPNLTSFL